MTQKARVTKLLDRGLAEVSVLRTSACGDSCASCGASCAFKKSMTVTAENIICARPGDAVMLETKSFKIFLAAAVVYIFPLVLFLAAYFITSAAGAGEAASILISIGAMFAGIGTACLYDRRIRRRRSIEYRIVSLADVEAD